MRHIFILSITIYQKYIKYIFKGLLGIDSECRFSKKCPDYAREVYLNYGTIKGTYLTAKRLLKCQPLYKGN